MKYFCLITVLSLVMCNTKHIRKDIRIAHYTGIVKINTSDVNLKNTILNRGDIIETGDNSECDIIINEKNIIRLKGGSRLNLKISVNDIVIRLDRGSLTCVTREVFSRGEKFRIETPALNVTTGKASFCVKTDNERNTYICICNGTAAIETKTGSGDIMIESPHHSPRRFTIEKNNALIEDNIPGVLYHSDNEIEQIAGIIGERIEWSLPAAH